MLPIVIEFHCANKYSNYPAEIVRKVSSPELTMIWEMNEQSNNHWQLYQQNSRHSIQTSVELTRRINWSSFENQPIISHN